MRYVQFLILMLLLVGSFVVMSYAITADGIEGIVFTAGLAMFILSTLGAVEIGRRGLHKG
ncbi:hypothetical protein ACIQC8_05005 [Agrococcus sediminis]|jgi:hypothetical protein|uniref:hypothetical protein n=1 Tax=Agrococcus TaxID=46352 RepID=UPI001FF23316|nr:MULTISPECIES: hypothetical protein [unclassified Agrococcus]MDR7234579.1 hypothetical protein [Agrococcus sp. BE272]UOW00544.1 hypothetical protein MU522_11555 [Agrococcus sp. SCSIO52902]